MTNQGESDHAPRRVSQMKQSDDASMIAEAPKQSSHKTTCAGSQTLAETWEAKEWTRPKRSRTWGATGAADACSLQISPTRGASSEPYARVGSSLSSLFCSRPPGSRSLRRGSSHSSLALSPLPHIPAAPCPLGAVVVPPSTRCSSELPRSAAIRVRQSFVPAQEMPVLFNSNGLVFSALVGLSMSERAFPARGSRVPDSWGHQDA